MKSIGLSKIDAFIWTHPDKDHSTGIPFILDAFDSTHEARIIMPGGLHKGLPLCKEAEKDCKYINKLYNSCHQFSRVRRVEVAEDWPLTPRVLLFKEHMSDRIMTCSFRYLAPHTSVVQRYDFSSSPKHNQLSIVLKVSFNALDFLYTGDLLNQTTSLLGDIDLLNLQYIKIPHHGSSSSSNVLRIIENAPYKNMVAVSTINTKNNLPEDSILREYLKKSDEVFVTGPGHNCIMGVVKSIYKIKDTTHKVICIGSAHPYK